jgi:hypothetical protein
MLSRTLILATMMLWIGCLAAERALAQENLEAGKSPSQIFAGTCNACHKSPRGLLKTVAAGSLPGFLRQHYTTSPNMANVLSAYLVSNGANDPKAAAAAAKEAKGAKEGSKEGPKEGTKEAKQDAAKPIEQLDRFGRRQHATAAPTAPPEPAPTAGDKPPDIQQPAANSKWSAKQKLTKRGKPGEDMPREEPAATEPPKGEAATAEPGVPEGGSSAAVSPSQSAKIEPPKETPALRPDPVPPVTPAPLAPAPSASPAASAATPAAATPPPQPITLPPATVSAAATNNSGGSEPMPVMALPPSPPTVAASAPLPPVPPAGPPVPPISR